MTTLKKANKALDEYFGNGKIELVKGQGYFYFSGSLAEQMKRSGLYVNSLRFFEPAQIVRAAVLKIEENK